MSKVSAKLKEEFEALLPPTIFFFVAFHIIVFLRSLMLREYGVQVSSLAGATVGALLVGKAVLLADKIPIINRFPDKPLIYNVVWKTLIYLIASLFVHYLEHLLPIWWRTGSLAEANRRIVEEVVWPHFWAVQLLLLLLLLIYCAFRELIRAIGRDEVWRMFFVGPAKKSGAES